MITSSDRAYREKIDRSRRALDPLLKVARERFGVSYLYPIQRFVVSNTLESRPQIVVLPTGSGKSLCFQLPALLLPGPTLVLMPLLSLLADQLRAMLEAGVPVGALRGGLSTEEKASLFEGIRSGRIRLVLATPEACLAEANMPRLAECGFSHLVVDEAHCVSEWGDTFRPAYREVGIIAVKLSIPMVSAFTATASEAVIARIRSLLFGDGDVRIVAGSADRPNISYSVLPVLSIGHALGELLRTAARPLLIFCRTRNGAEISARDALRRFPDIPTRFYHAGLTRDERADVEKWYLHSKDGALFATCAYGMGVDKSNIRTVAHMDVPSSVEAYLQETGRAGRDGEPSKAVLFLSAEDRAFLGRIPEETERRRYASMLGYASGSSCRRNTLLSLIGQDQVACSGCDACAGAVVARPAGESEMLSFVRAHRRRFTPGRAAAILAGKCDPRSIRNFDDCREGFGTLASWESEDVEAGLWQLVAEGRLRLPSRGPWKGRLTTSRPRTIAPEAI